MAKTATTKKSLNLVERIVAALKGGDEVNVVKFFEKERKRCATAIKSHKHNLAAEKSQYEITKEKLTDQLEDANENVATAYENVKPGDVTNNAARDSFSPDYWSNIDRAEAAVEDIVAKQEELERVFTEGGSVYVDGEIITFDGSDSINEQIAKHEGRIAKIS